MRAILESMPDDVIFGGDHDYGQQVNDLPPTTSLKSDNETRWNSKYIMFNSIYPKREVIRTLLYDHDRYVASVLLTSLLITYILLLLQLLYITIL